MNSEVPAPTRFRFGQNGEDFMIGVEVAKFLNKPASALYKQYPSMHRRTANLAERMILGSANLSHNVHVTLVKASEVDRIVEQNDADLRVAPEPVAVDTPIGVSVRTQDKDSEADGDPATGLVLDAPEAYAQSAMFRRTKLKMPSNSFVDEIRVGGEIDPEVVSQQAEQELLVPITLDLEEGGYRVRENLVWNYNEPRLQVETFAHMMCDDLEVPKSMASLIANSMREQLSDFAAYNYSWDQPEERRVTITLRIHVGNTQLSDQFEWDINNPQSSPEEFATRLCADMALGGEFVSTVAHSIREQILIYRKNLLETHIGQQLDAVTYPPLRSVKDESWGPSLETVSEQDIELFQKQRDREMRRLRRLRRKTTDYGGRKGRGANPY